MPTGEAGGGAFDFVVGDEVKLHRAGDGGDDAHRRATHHALRVHPLQEVPEQAGRTARGGVAAGVVVGNIGGPQVSNDGAH